MDSWNEKTCQNLYANLNIIKENNARLYEHYKYQLELFCKDVKNSVKAIAK